MTAKSPPRQIPQTEVPSYCASPQNIAVLDNPAGVGSSATLNHSPDSSEDTRFIAEARFYRKLPDGRVRCTLCPRQCSLREGVRGDCGVRENRHGSLYTLVHSRVCAAHVDPVEKKPLFHYMPGSIAFSIATAGCNVHCRFCQNWEISQARPEDVPSQYLPPDKVIAFTYTEPTVASEFVIETADVAQQNGIHTIAISNGYIHKNALPSVYGRMDAVKIDLKAFSETYYHKVVIGQLKPVLETLVALVSLGKWTEIVYLLVPTLNDSDKELTALVRWIKANLGLDVPLHFSQFFPDYKLTHLPPTPVASLEHARQIALGEGIHFVYIGNVPRHPAENTYCPQCSRLLVQRSGYEIRQMLIGDNACPFCHEPIPGVWSH
jgi:pyruvate formate lyase activating enzyme